MLSIQDKLFIKENLSEDVKNIALRYHSKSDLDYAFLIQQISGKQRVKSKITTFYKNENVIYPPQLNIEQSSSEITANYKSKLVTGKTGCDLTGGFGVDTYFLSKKFEKFDYVEPNKSLLNIVKHNLIALNQQNIILHNCKAEDYISKINKVDFIYIDPSRRTSKGKVVFIEDYEPNVIDLLDKMINKNNEVLIKTSPMLDITDSIKKLKSIAEIHIVAVKNEVKEVLYFLKSTNSPIIIKTINFQNDENFQAFDFIKGINSIISFSNPLEYLYEPNKAIMKSGGYDILANKIGLSKLNSNSHLYTSEKLINDFQGRAFKIKSIKKYDKKEFKDLSQANITTKNFPYSVQDIRIKLKIKDGGSNYLFATTDINDKLVILVCTKEY